MRHAVTIGGEQGPVDRQISVSNCELKSTGGVQALDSHGHAESFTFENNRIHGGIVFGGTCGKIIGNEIYGFANAQASEALRASEWKGTSWEIRNNRIHTTAIADWSGMEGALYLWIGKHTVDADGPTIIAGNSVFVAGRADDRRGIYLLNGIDGNSPARWVVIIENNYFEAETNGFCVSPRDGLGTIDIVLLRNNVFKRCRPSQGASGTIREWIDGGGNITLSP